jgi:hypothetical protein
MGRRSRNKQPSPVPLEPNFPSKKLGKRKAPEDKARLAQRPAKKIKDAKGKSLSVVKKAKLSTTGKRKAVEFESDVEDGSDWEDEGDLKR